MQTNSKNQLTMLDQYAGIGAATLAGEMLNIQTTEFIEINPAAQAVLRYHYPAIAIHPDICTYNPVPHLHDIYWISFPCTGTSSAGKRAGLNHPDSALWYESLRTIIKGQPNYVIVEQPEGFIYRGLREVLGGLSLAGYQAEVELIKASELGAPHRRSRVFIVAHANHLKLQQRERWQPWTEQISHHIETARQITSYSGTQLNRVRVDDGIPKWLGGISFDCWWKANRPPQKPGIRKEAERTKATIKATSISRQAITLYGKSIVPLQAAIALMRVHFLASL